MDKNTIYLHLLRNKPENHTKGLLFYQFRKLVQINYIYVFIYFPTIYIQLSKGKNCDPINRLNHATFLWLSQAKTWMSNIIGRGFFVFSELMWEIILRFVDIGEIFYHQCLNLLFIIVYIMVANIPSRINVDYSGVKNKKKTTTTKLIGTSVMN